MKIKLKLVRAENQQYYNANEIEIDLEEYLKGVVPSEIGNAPVEACAA
jgi:peptidoglycan hydrolase-like amidase